jgi:Holliday junction resolvasome RuvABC endonuclease subunit
MKRTKMNNVKDQKILALDVATHCGWAVDKNVFGVWDFSAKRDESAGMRLIRLRSKLHEIIPAENVTLVVFERPAGFYKSSLIVESELVGQVKTVCEELKIPYRGYSATEIKKYATGKGNASKALMISAARERLGYTGEDDNEADALWLLELAKFDYNAAIS